MSDIRVVSAIGTRKKNQDTLLFDNRVLKEEDYFSYSYDSDSELQLFAIADGVGGENFGEQVSAITIDLIKTKYQSFLCDNKNSINSKVDFIPSIISTLQEQAQTFLGKTIGGTTLSCLLLDKRNNIYLAFNIGDSPIYHMTKKMFKLKIKPIYTEHTLAEEKIRTGDKNISEADRHTLMQCIGSAGVDSVSISTGKFNKKDVFIIGSDGFFLQSNKMIKKCIKQDSILFNKENYFQLNDNSSAIIINT